MDLILVAIALGAAFCFALGLVLTRIGLGHADPLSGGAVSVPTSALLFLVLAPLTIDPAAWNATSAALFAGAGLLFPVTVTLLTFAAIRPLGPTLAGTISNLSPLFAIALAVVWLGETPSGGQYLGAAAVCAGVALLFAGPAGHRNWPLWALALPFGSALVKGLVQPVVKFGMIDWPNPFAAVTIGYLVSAAVLVGLRLARRWRLAPLTAAARRRFMVVGLANGGAVLLLYMALARGPVTIVAPLVAIYPLITLALNHVVLRDTNLNRYAIAGIAVTVVGVVLLLRS